MIIIIRSRLNNSVRILFCVLFMFCLYASAAAGEGLFSVQCSGPVVSNSSNIFSFSAPEDGILTITVSDRYYTYRDIRAEVRAGTGSIEWDGCSWNSSRLSQQAYIFDCTLTGNSGTDYTCSFKASVTRNAQYLQFALPSSHTVYQNSGDDWFIEAKSVLNGTLVIEFCPAGSDTPVFTVKKTLHQRRVEHFTYTKLTEKNSPAPGDYTVKAYEISRPSDAFSFPLLVEAGDQVRDPVRVTGPVMPPADADDTVIWEYMMRPSVVLNIDYTKSHNVYQEPDPKSGSLGTLHGQTQAVEVLEIRGSWAKVGAWNHEDASYIEGWVPLEKLKVEYPDEEYGLLLSKKDQTLTLFRRGERIATMLVSTGRMSKYKLIRETSAGSYLTGLHRVDFSMQGNRYDYVIQYDGGNLLHQIPYTSDGKKDIRYGRAYLGSKASHACIRIQDTPCGDYGVNAYWIWTHLPYHTRLIIFDDRAEREKTVAYLKGRTISDPFPGISAETDSSVFSVDDTTVRLTFAGSVVPGEKVPVTTSTITSYLDKYGNDYPFSGLKELFSGDDLTCVSLECVLKDNNSGRNKQRAAVFRAKTDRAGIFPAGSVEMVCLANSHVTDFGQEGLDSTLMALTGKTGTVRQGHPAILSLKGHVFGFGACTDDEYLSDREVIARDIRQLRDAGCEYVVYQCHFEVEDEAQRGKLQEAMAWACSRAGADLVVGHGPSAVQGIDLLDGMPVIYSLGKIVRGGTGLQRSYDALAVRIDIRFDGGRAETGITLVPVLATSSDRKNNYRPAVAEGKDKARILQQIQADTVYDLSALISGR